MTAMLQPVAPLAVLLEGGYNLSATAAATEACLRVLLGKRPPALPFEDRAPSASGLAVIQHVIRTQVHQACLQFVVYCLPAYAALMPCFACSLFQIVPDARKWECSCCCMLI